MNTTIFAARCGVSRLVPPLYAEEFRRRSAGSRVELIDKVAHLLPFEQPGATAQAVQNFLK